MVMEFKVFSQKMAEDPSFLAENGVVVPHIWISITSPDDPKANLQPDPNRLDTLFLEFFDVEFSRPNYPPMSEDHAKEIINFVQKYVDKVGLICVNCQAGISRSAGCAAGLSILINGHDRGIGDSPRFHPNVHVKSLILRHSPLLKIPDLA
jgi:predicted protein tyrosine phosphatase